MDFKNLKKLHFTGIGGIGMSGLAQMLKSLDFQITGSDRAYKSDENTRIISPLKKQGIKIFPQNGSFAEEAKPDAIIFSSAIEEDNPDFLAASEYKIPKYHRSEALRDAMKLISSAKKIKTVAVAGSCGKTTVTSWLGETLDLSGKDPSILSGGLISRYISEKNAGNFKAGSGEYFIFEADESDKSLLNYSPDYALIMNLSNDHYEMSELLNLFRKFAGKIKTGAVIQKEALDIIGKKYFADLNYTSFSSNPKSDADFILTDSKSFSSNMQFVITVNSDKIFNIPLPGKHNAENALGIFAFLSLSNFGYNDFYSNISDFKGVWRRFNIHGRTENGTVVIDDYAHNPEKIISAYRGLLNITSGKVLVIFQPHGYKPLSFMQNELFEKIENTFKDDSLLAMLPVFYAGGTTSFKPKSETVIKKFRKNSVSPEKYLLFENRRSAEKFILEKMSTNDSILVCGARDNSLSDWCGKIVSKQNKNKIIKKRTLK